MKLNSLLLFLRQNRDRKTIKIGIAALLVIIIVWLSIRFITGIVVWLKVSDSESINLYLDRVLTIVLGICLLYALGLVGLFFLSFQKKSFVKKRLRQFNFLILGGALFFTAISSSLQFVSTNQNAKVVETEQQSKSIDRYFNLKEKYDQALKERGGPQFLEQRIQQLEFIDDLYRKDQILFADDILLLIEEMRQDSQPLLYTCFQSITILDDKKGETKRQLMTFLGRSLTRNEQILLYWLASLSEENQGFLQEMVQHGHLQEAISFFEENYALKNMINTLPKNANHHDLYDALQTLPKEESEKKEYYARELKERLEKEFTALYLHGCLIGDRSCLNQDKTHDCVIHVLPDEQFHKLAKIVLPTTEVNPGDPFDDTEDENSCDSEEEIEKVVAYERKLSLLRNKYWDVYIREYTLIDARIEIVKELESAISGAKKELAEESYSTPVRRLQLKERLTELEKRYSAEQIELRLLEHFIEDYSEGLTYSEDGSIIEPMIEAEEDENDTEDVDLMIQLVECRIRALQLQKSHLFNVKHSRYCLSHSHRGCTRELLELYQKVQFIPDSHLLQIYNRQLLVANKELERYKHKKAVKFRTRMEQFATLKLWHE